MRSYPAAGLRAIAPDMRGYGLTDRPADVAGYAIPNLCADLVGLLDALDIERALFCGHDWGRGGGVGDAAALPRPGRSASSA